MAEDEPEEKMGPATCFSDAFAEFEGLGIRDEGLGIRV